MSNIVQAFSLNLIPNSAPVVIHVNQYDESEERFIITLYNGNVQYVPISGARAIIEGTKPDGRGYSYNCRISGGLVYADLKKQMTVVPGKSRVNIILYEPTGILEEEDRIGSFVFYLDVQATGLADDVDTSESELAPYIDGAQSAARDAAASAETATTAATTATAAAASIGDSVERAETAATTASTAATSASASATTATTAATNASASATSASASAVSAAASAAEAEQYAQGGLIFKGSVTFANIPTTGMKTGDMYNITDDFTTDSRFEEGAGVSVKAGTNIAWNTNSKWDLLAVSGGGVTGDFFSLYGTTLISSTDDLNNFTTVGNYYYDGTGSTKPSHCPSNYTSASKQFSLKVFNAGGENTNTLFQLFIAQDNDIITFRHKQGNSWYSWVKIFTSDFTGLNDLYNVVLSSSQNGQTIGYNSSNYKWENKYLSGLSYDASNTLADIIGDVETLLASL